MKTKSSFNVIVQNDTHAVADSIIYIYCNRLFKRQLHEQEPLLIG